MKVIDGQKIPFEFTVMSNSGNEVRKQIGLILAEKCRKVGGHGFKSLKASEGAVWSDSRKMI